MSSVFNLSIICSNTGTFMEVRTVPLLVNLLTKEDHEWLGLVGDALVVVALLFEQWPMQTVAVYSYVAVVSSVVIVQIHF